MVFKRRNKRSLWQWVADAFYPKGGWGRAASYVMHRLRRLPDPPHKIARGIAAGVFASFTPFYGFHFVTAALVGYLMQGNLLAALLATFVGNPFTFPIIATVSLELGNWILGRELGIPLPEIVQAFSRASVELWHNFTAMFTDEVAHWDRLGVFFDRVFLPYLVGGILPGIVTATVAYWLALPAVTAYQKRRRKKAMKQRKAAAQPAGGATPAD
ncbi:MAG: DUF2062 domain-containing protein [Paracoccaceae bacterium]